MTTSIRYNGQIPPDQIITLFLGLTCIAYISTLNYEQAHALAAAGSLAELAMLVLRLLPGRR